MNNYIYKKMSYIKKYIYNLFIGTLVISILSTVVLLNGNKIVID